MTADISDEPTADNSPTKAIRIDEDANTEPAGSGDLPPEIIGIFEFLSCNDKIVFKSQQIDDPELQRVEKVQIAREIYNKNRQTFLMRFGNYFDESHLRFFTQSALSSQAAPLKDDEHYDEIQLLLADLKRKLKTRKQDVKNRRYAAMRQLISQGEYFSEQEMMKRAPELYQELVGQYLSEAEIKQRDSYDVKNTSFSGILMHTMEKQEMDDVLKQADKRNQLSLCIQEISDGDEDCNNTNSLCNSSDNSNSSTATASTVKAIKWNPEQDDSREYEVPASFRQQWGNFDNENIACSTSRLSESKSRKNGKAKVEQYTLKYSNKERNNTYITAGERNLLRQEFVDIMHEQFLAGNDKDFDYAQVDDNSQLDDLHQLNQDKEDEYFEASDDDDRDGVIGESDSVKAMQEETDNGENDLNESEDELDIYMSHLNKHFSLHK